MQSNHVRFLSNTFALRQNLLVTMASLPALAVVEILANVGFDRLFFDGEHGPLINDFLLAMLLGGGRQDGLPRARQRQ
ncbi:MAG: hypothetical protein M2R45_02018 [Verrucomicrobia subdivision 3 bacterium]|nr:hypothetical protein [Limisphaerales bacterium]MCS1414837.1 hypothetical protein [Limisphaerales bacterium]